MSTIELDWDRLVEDVVPLVVDAGRDLVAGAEKDLRAFGQAISRDAIEAQLRGDREVLAQLADQLRVLAEVHRIRTTSASWAVFSKVLNAIFKAAAAGVAAAL